MLLVRETEGLNASQLRGAWQWSTISPFGDIEVGDAPYLDPPPLRTSVRVSVTATTVAVTETLFTHAMSRRSYAASFWVASPVSAAGSGWNTTIADGNGAGFLCPPNLSRPRRNSTVPFMA